MDLLSDFRAAFWEESVWTPQNTTWEMYEKNGYRKFNDIYYSAYTALVLFALRLFLDKTIFVHVGVWLGLKDKVRRLPAPNKVLEKTFGRTRGKLEDEQIAGLIKQTDMTERQIQRWMRQRSAYSRPTILNKFTESAWRCFFYFVMFTYGVAILWNKPWLWDSVHCFQNYPHHHVTTDQWWYYNIEAGFYLSLMVSQFFDAKRKDFWAMFLHHVVSLALIGFSWACNLYRIGTLVLVIHDLADIPLEFAKTMVYAKKQKVADIFFVIFAFCWTISRVICLPYRIIYHSTYVALQIVPMFPAYYIFTGLLSSLQLIQFYWTYFIIKMAIKAWNNNSEIKDTRSDEETETESDEAEGDAGKESTKVKKDSNDNHCETLVNRKNGLVNGKR